MPYNSLIDRTEAAPLVSEEVITAFLNDVAGTNPLMSMARRLPNMSKAQARLPVWQAMATAYFVNGDTGLKQTTDVSWTNKYIDAEEVAVIIPIPEKVLDDNDYDIWAQVRPEALKAVNKAVTQAVLFGTNIPATWTTNIGAAGLLALCTAKGSTISLAAYADLYEATLGESAGGADGLFMLVEADGFDVNGSIAHLSMKGKYRNVRDADGQPIFKRSMQEGTRYELDGTPISFPNDGSMVAASCLQFSGDWNQLAYSIRQDLTWKLLDQAVITDPAGNIIYNLPQQDMVALRLVTRLGFACPNPINRENEVEATRSPFAALTA